MPYGIKSIKNCQQQFTIDRVNEGTNAFYKISAVMMLVLMSQFRSINFSKILTMIRNTTEGLSEKLRKELDKNYCLSVNELLIHNLLKKKHYYYGAYLSALTSLPILSYVTNNDSVLASMIAKTSAITSIKILDNIHDRFENKQKSIESQKHHLKAFTKKSFECTIPDNFLVRAENSCMNMARWTHEIVTQGLDNKAKTFTIYVKDFSEYIDGQIKSMDEKNEEFSSIPTIQHYLQKINEKSVGRIWVDIDFCFLEKALKKLDKEEFQAVLHVRRAADCFFKGCNLYDDIADLEEDLKLNIYSSVPLLALDRGIINENDLKLNNKELQNILRKRGAINEAVQLADLIFLNGIKPLMEARKLTKLIDAEAIIYGAKILRMFAIRKWLFHERSINSLFKTIVSLGSLRLYNISDPIIAYTKYI